jgi:hypothetical protein
VKYEDQLIFLKFYLICGLFQICTEEPNVDNLVELIESLGMIPIQSGSFKFGHETKNDYFYEVILNGKPLGYIESANVNDLTTLKI